MPGPVHQTKHANISKILSERIKFMLPGEPIPTVAELMEEFATTQATITSALTRLRSRGAIERPAGRKRFVVAAQSARALHQIALVRPLWSSPDFDAVSNAIFQIGQEESWEFTVHNFAGTPLLNLERAVGNADAAIILGANLPPPDVLRSFKSSRTPLVFLRDKHEEVKFSSIQFDDREAGVLATRHLIDLGHQRILVMLSEPPNPSSTLRMVGWRQEMLNLGVKRYEELIVDCSVKTGMSAIAGSYRRFKQWLASNRTDFTAIFCVSWTGAFATMRAFRELGIRIPDDVSLITFDSESSLSDYLNPPLTTVQTDAEVHAKATVQLLKEALQHNPAEPRDVFIKPELVVRESTAAPKTKSD